MGFGIKLETKGFSEYLERVAAAGNNVDEAAAAALKAGGAILLPGMKRRVRKLTSHLESSLVVDGPHQDGNQHYIIVGIDRAADGETKRYANAQEFGTSSMAAQSYIRSTMDEDKAKARKAMRDSFRASLL